MEDRFLNSEARERQFAALGSPGSKMYMGLEIFPNPGCAVVQLEFDELMCKCPITGQPDWYSGTIVLAATDNLIESKSLKLFFHNIIESTFTKNMGLFGEALAVYIRDQLREALDAEENEVHVILKQKSRGGISITAHA